MFRSSEICKELRTIALLGKGTRNGPGLLSSFRMNAQNDFFQLPNLKKYCLGVEVASAHQVIKKRKMDYWGLCCISLHAATVTELK